MIDDQQFHPRTPPPFPPSMRCCACGAIGGWMTCSGCGEHLCQDCIQSVADGLSWLCLSCRLLYGME